MDRMPRYEQAMRATTFLTDMVNYALKGLSGARLSDGGQFQPVHQGDSQRGSQTQGVPH